MRSTQEVFLEFDLEMRVLMLSGVTGLESKVIEAGMWTVIVWMLGWFTLSFETDSVCSVLGDIHIERVRSTCNRDLV